MAGTGIEAQPRLGLAGLRMQSSVPRLGGRDRRLGMRALVAGCLLLAGFSLLAPSAPGYDVWGWIVWGREVAHLDLDTTAGPSWKPLPVLFTTVFSLAGDAAPALWLVLARAGGLAALALAYRLAYRLAGPAAGALAVVALLLSPDIHARWLRLVALGSVEPLLVALLLWAVERHLDGRRDHAYVLGFLAALIRPEVWPFLGLYAVLLWREEPSKRLMVGALLAGVPLLWFGGDWWGSGSPLTGPERARVAPADIHSLEMALRHMAGLVIVPVWLAAAAGVAFAALRREQTTLALATGALAWLGILAVGTAALGFATTTRFMVPAAAVVSVLAGIGAVGLVHLAGERHVRLAVGAVLVAATLPFALPRVQALPEQIEVAVDRGAAERDLRVAVRRAGGRSGLLACGRLAADKAGDAKGARLALAWQLDVPLGRVRHWLDGRPGIVLVRSGGVRERFLSRPNARVRHLASSSKWEVYAVRCPAVPASAVADAPGGVMTSERPRS